MQNQPTQDDTSSSPLLVMAEDFVEPSGYWTNGWAYYDNNRTGRRIPLNYDLAEEVQRNRPGASTRYHRWKRQAETVKDSLIPDPNGA